MSDGFLTRSKLLKKSGKLDRLPENVDIPDFLGTIDWKVNKDGFFLFTYTKHPEVIENDLPEM